jgi:hypothetical protein
MSQDRLKHSITIAKHIPSGTQYVPADCVTLTDSWEEDSTDYADHFKALDSKANEIIRQWTNPAERAAKGEEPAATSTVVPMPPEEPIGRADTSILSKAQEAVEKVPWRSFQGASDADRTLRGKTEPGWAFADKEATSIAAWAKVTPSPHLIGGWEYTLSKDERFVNRKKVLS